MYDRLSTWEYNDKALRALKKLKIDPEIWISKFILELDFNNQVSKEMAEIRRDEIVDIFEVRQQTVAGFNYEVSICLKNRKKFKVRIFVPLRSRGGNPEIRSVTRLEAQSIIKPISQIKPLLGGWSTTSVKEMYGLLSSLVYNDKDLTALKRERFDGPESWITEFILNLDVNEEATRKMDVVRRGEIVKICEVRQQTVAGWNFEVTVRLKSRAKYKLSIFVPSTRRGGNNPEIRSVKQLEAKTPKQPVLPKRPILLGGWFTTTVKNMYDRLSTWEYNDKALRALKKLKIDPEIWISKFILELDFNNQVSKEMAEIRRDEIVDIFEVRQQTVAGFNYEVSICLKNRKKFKVRIFVPLRSRGGNPEIRSVTRLEAQSIIKPISQIKPLLGGWSTTSVKKMYKHLSTLNYDDEDLTAMKKQDFADPASWISKFILELDFNNEATKKMAEIRRDRIVDISEVRQQIVAGSNYEVSISLKNRKKFKVRIFVPLPSGGGDPVIRSVKRLEAQPIIKPTLPSKPLLGGWSTTSVETMYGLLSTLKYTQKDLTALKRKKFNGPESWIIKFILKLDVSRKATRNMAVVRRNKIVKISKVRQQVVAGLNYEVYIQSRNRKRSIVTIFVPIAKSGKSPRIISVKLLKRHHRHHHRRHHHRHLHRI